MTGIAYIVDFAKYSFKQTFPKDRIRLHDLRHTFAVHSLAKMAEEGMDLYCSLPILSTYLGHQSLRATNNYVRLTSEMYPELIRKIDIIGFDIFLKCDIYETYKFFKISNRLPSPVFAP